MWKKSVVVDSHGTKQSFKGELFNIGGNAGYYLCYYGRNNAPAQNSETTCTANNNYWNSQNHQCYYGKTGPGENITYTCNEGYHYVEKPNDYNGVNGMNPGCYKVFSQIYYCDNGTLSGLKCIVKVQAY